MAGLAEMGAQAPVNQERQAIDEVKQLLLQGINPQELLNQGVPEQLIAMAIQELEAEIASQQQQAQPAATPAGQQMSPGLAAQGA